MFNFLKKIFNNFMDKTFTMSEKDWQKYYQEIRKNNKEQNKCLIGNFSQRGFDYIYYELIESANNQIVFFIKDYNSIFDNVKFRTLEMMCKKFERCHGIIDIYTFNSKKDERFLNLENTYKCIKYTALKTNNDTDLKKLNNFILVDSNKYWLEEAYTTFKRTNINNNEEFLKACCNFNDYNKTYELYDYIKHIERNI